MSDYSGKVVGLYHGWTSILNQWVRLLSNIYQEDIQKSAANYII